MIIYLITNKINGLMYVGQTIYTLKKRWSEHKCNAKMNSNIYLHKAIFKYGFDQFYVEQIDSAKTLKELNMLEVYWIEVLNTFLGDGYNLTSGGKNYKRSVETIQKMSKSQKGKKRSKEICKKMSEMKKGKKVNNKGGNCSQNMTISCQNSSFFKGLYKGVYFIKSNNKYRVYIMYLSKKTHIGYYKESELAAIAYNEACDKYWGVGIGYRNVIQEGILG